MNSGNLNFLEHSGPLQVCNGTNFIMLCVITLLLLYQSMISPWFSSRKIHSVFYSNFSLPFLKPTYFRPDSTSSIQLGLVFPFLSFLICLSAAFLLSCQHPFLQHDHMILVSLHAKIAVTSSGILTFRRNIKIPIAASYSRIFSGLADI